MKKMFVLTTGFAVLLASAYGVSQLVAQPPAAGAVPQVQGTKVAVVNIGLVFNKYKRAVVFKADLEETLKPFKTKAMKLQEEMKSWAEAMQKPGFEPSKKEQYQKALRNNQRELEDMELQIKNLLGKKQEDNLITLWKEVNMGIDAVAKAYGFQIVLGYGDPMEKDMLNQFPNINRKMQAMDLGSTVPLYVHGSVDLSAAIADTLNDWFDRQNKTPAPVTPTSGTK